MTDSGRMSTVRPPVAPAVLLLAAALTALLVVPQAQAAAAWSSNDKWATRADGGYLLRNDVWGGGAGPQTIWANSYKNWGVHADHPTGGGVRAYPHVAKTIDRQLSALTGLTSTYAVKVPSGGVYNTAYDIWANGQDYEIMVWVGAAGGAGPISQTATVNADVGGGKWTIHRGSNGTTKATISFVLDSSSPSGTVDLLAILKYIKAHGWFDDVKVGEVQFGWEISASPGGMDFEVTDYKVDVS